METLIVFITALLVVAATSLLKNVQFSHKVKHAVATVVALIGAGVAAFFTGDWQQANPADLSQLAFAVYGSSQLLYNFILKGTRVNETLELNGVTPSQDY